MPGEVLLNGPDKALGAVELIRAVTKLHKMPCRW